MVINIQQILDQLTETLRLTREFSGLDSIVYVPEGAGRRRHARVAFADGTERVIYLRLDDGGLDTISDLIRQLPRI